MAALPRPVIDTPPTSPAIEPVSVLVASATTSTPPPPLMLTVSSGVSVKVSTAAPPWRLAKLLKVTLLVPPLSVYAPLVPVRSEQPTSEPQSPDQLACRLLLATKKPPETLALVPLYQTLVPAVPMAALPRHQLHTPPASPATEPVGLFFEGAAAPRPLHSFPTRRSSDLSVKVSTAAPPWRLAKLLKVTLLVPPLSVYAPLVPV